MQNSSNNVGPTKNPKFEFLKLLVRECYFTNVTHSEVVPDQKYDENAPWCPRLFDGFACWDQAPARSIVVQHCPEFIIGFDPRLSVYKRYVPM
ncbi:Neuropeptide receptor B4 [Operophtera brumata]|uniref:Neuropeptide receptor B4 n=1 Tax=Operophtera brumata TaxID=104452 RepID=A0A0L7LJF8_OPEBR|nr:Neuropeptide receptor B4 [Operophtera brumata]